MPHPQTDAVAAHAASRFDATLARLDRYLRVEAISCEPAHAEDVRRLAGLVRDDLAALGLDRARVCELDGAHPIVAAEWLRAGADKPTVLVYGHLDLQPVAGESWTSDPHVPTVRDGRLYARGAADDMGGWVSHIGAMEAWFATTGELPCNLKVIIEGEEEIGSPNLERFMDAYPDVFDADVMVLTDCENPSPDLPGLTVSLRGLMEVDLTVSALTADVHSGLWGNLAPDVSAALVTLLARLFDADGRAKGPRMDVPAAWREDAWKVPLDAETIRSGARLRDGVEPLPDHGTPPAEWGWRQPAITILSTTLPRPEARKNALRREATATLSLRIAPGQTDAELYAMLEETLLRDVPGGCQVALKRHEGAAESWLYEPKGPAFEAVDRAYAAAWGEKPVQIGVGGSIPFVALFGRRFGDLPLILNGVMDPETGAHGPDESMHLGLFAKAIAANVRLYAELGALPELARG
ncbi:MAG: M20/M25/M40 family metallo-hydrolase [Deltaproteobacteria bacterium]|nr:MAG: M20/M25/M40 family metallo-hydrolase [Deltaproteobacteria bacterium]